MLKGEPGHPDAEARTKYSIETINKAGIETEELAMDAAMWDSTKATEKMDAWIAKNGDNIEMVICNNDGMALGAISSLEKAGYLDGTPEKFIPIYGENNLIGIRSTGFPANRANARSLGVI